jgi:tetratricopeptide (TPR) repeat protein
VIYGREGVELYRKLDDRQGLAGLMITLSYAKTAGNESLTLAPPAPEEMTGLIDFSSEEALRLATEISWLPGQAFAHCNRSIAKLALGEYGTALREAREGLEIAERIGHEQWQTFANYDLGCAHMEFYSRGPADQHFERAHELAKSIGSMHWIRITAADWARHLARSGEIERGNALLKEHLQDDLPMISVGQRGLWLALAELELAAENPERAIEIINQLGATAKNAGADGVRAIPYLALLRGRALIAAGRLDEAAPDLEAALAAARKMGVKPLEWQTLRAMADRRVAAGRDDEARTWYALAFGIVQQLAQTIDDAALRHMYLIADPIEGLRKQARTTAAF